MVPKDKNYKNKLVNQILLLCSVHRRISKLGSGSDFEAYFIRLGIAAGRARYTKNKVGHNILTSPNIHRASLQLAFVCVQVKCHLNSTFTSVLDV